MRYARSMLGLGKYFKSIKIIAGLDAENADLHMELELEQAVQAVQARHFAEQAERGRAGDSSAQVVIRRLLSVFNKFHILIYNHFSAFNSFEHVAAVLLLQSCECMRHSAAASMAMPEPESQHGQLGSFTWCHVRFAQPPVSCQCKTHSGTRSCSSMSQ